MTEMSMNQLIVMSKLRLKVFAVPAREVKEMLKIEGCRRLLTHLIW